MAIPLRTPSSMPEESTHENDTLKISIEGRLQSLPGDDSMITIFRVPAHFREANKQLYEPRMVSIGPYYSGREELRAMEQRKLRYLHDFLGRGTGEQTPTLSSYVRAVREVEERARRSYYEQTKLFGIKNNEASVQSGPYGSGDSAEPSEQAQSDGFAEMLLLDGCFILETLLRWVEILENTADSLQSIGWGIDLLNSDLLLLENQIPFFVLVSLYTLLRIGRAPRDDRITTPKDQLVIDLVRLLENGAFSESRIVIIPDTVLTMEIHHLLHLYHEVFVPKPEPRDIQQDPAEEHASGGNSAEAQEQSNSRLAIKVVPCTTHLREAGVRFKRKESPKHMFDITFSNGVMEIPPLVIDHARKPLLVNLIAFEQSMGKKGPAPPLTSYTALMTALVRTGKDVEVLEKHGIINNMLSSADDAAKNYFNQLGDCCTLDYNKQYYASEFARLNRYNDSNWNKYKAKFRRDYCANPCSIVSFLVAVLVFSFAISQVSINFYRLRGPH